MRDPDRIYRILLLLMRYWSVNPDLRLGQIISNIACHNTSVFYVEDDKIEEWLEGELSKADE